MTSAEHVQIANRGHNLPARAQPAVAWLWNRPLTAAATSWCVVAVLGQLLMAAYVIGFYGRAAISGDLARWNKVLPHGFVAGDLLGNAVVVLHLLFTVLIVLGGAVQLIPAIRRHAPALHRWNGRAYLASAFVMSLGGLIMLATRGGVGALSQHIAIGINAVLIMVFAAMALHHAWARRLDLHRRWALRLFLAVSGVWFFRLGLTLWITVNRGPVGFDPESFTGPFLSALAFAQYLLPLAVLQLYFQAKSAQSELPRMLMTLVLAVLTLVTAAGIATATMILWWPRLS